MHDDIRPAGPVTAAIPVKEAPPEMPHTKLDTNIFKTPEQIANSDTSTSLDTTSILQPHDTTNNTMPTKKKSMSSKLKAKWQRLSKKQKVIFAVIVVVLLGGGGTAFALTRPKATPAKPLAKAQLQVAPVAKPTTVASDLSGLQVAPEVNQRPVTGVMIENSDDARPQSGLDQASIVFEAVAEGGITRFLALFQDTLPDYIGPVRSARPYYVQWCLSFDCAYAHVGGSPEALSDIPAWGVKDLDQFANGSFYQRITSRIAPHNVYTSMAQLNTLEANKGFKTPKFTSLPRKADSPAKTLTASSINFQPSSADFAVHYQYVAATNLYNREEGGSPHMELTKTGQRVPITPKVVIAMIVPQGLEADDHHTSYTTLGSGPARIFQDGLEVDCVWHKAANNSPLSFTDVNNQPLKLDAGQTWITILGTTSEVSFSH